MSLRVCVFLWRRPLDHEMATNMVHDDVMTQERAVRAEEGLGEV
jgi:hypothetical protein